MAFLITLAPSFFSDYAAINKDNCTFIMC